MTRAARSFLALLALALTGAGQQPAPAPALAAAPAPAPAGVEGVYAMQRMETASALQITPDGRFAWFLSYGALDMAGEGRWSRSADGGLLLNSEPAYLAPRFEPAGTSRDNEPGLLVRVTDESGNAPIYLEAVVEYDDGERDLGTFDDGAHRFTAPPGRRIVAVYLGSRAFDVISDRYPVSAEANVMRFHYFPNHVGRADFRDLPVSVEADALTFTWRGTAMRYVRQGEAEMAAEDPSGLTDSELGIDRGEAIADPAGDLSDAPDPPALLGPPEPVLRAVGGWTLQDPRCRLTRTDPRGGEIAIEASYSFAPEIHYQMFAGNQGWAIAQTDQSYALEAGFDGAPGPRHEIAVPISLNQGFASFTLDADLRARFRGHRSLEIYRDGQAIGSIDLGEMDAALAALDACANGELDYFARQEAINEVRHDENQMFDLDAEVATNAAVRRSGGTPGEGLWVGPIHLCRELVRTVTLDPPLGAGHGVSIAMAPSLAPAFERETASLIDQPIPISIDGRMVSQPIVRERISAAITIDTQSQPEAEAIRDASQRPC